MSRWFRFHADAMRNPKVARLTDREFRLWVRLLCVASECEGNIPPLDDLKLVLNSRLDHLLAGVERLLSAGLIDRKGDGYEPHNWNKFQYKSDTSTDRVQKHRANRNVSETPPDTEQIQKQKVAPKGALAMPGFDAFWSVYPEKVGKGAARKAFPLAISKAPLEILIAGVHRYIATKPADRSYCYPSTWLNEERWDDQPTTPQARGSPLVVPLKDTPANAARRRLEKLEDDRRSRSEIDDHQPIAGLLPGYSERTG